MKTAIVSAALASVALVPSAAQAQAIPAAVIAVVDLDKVTTDCTACKVASATLKSQGAALEARQRALGEPLQAEAKSIQAAIDALQGKPADSALQARVKSFQARQQAGASEIQSKQENLQRLETYVRQQIGAKLGPIYSSVMQKRGANVLLEQGATLAAAQAIDVTADITAGLNAALPSISTALPAQKLPQSR